MFTGVLMCCYYPHLTWDDGIRLRVQSLNHAYTTVLPSTPVSH
jgi:hypothetical protein